MKKVLNILILAVLTTSMACSPSRRLARLVAHHPELAMADTLLLRDTVAVQPVEADTIVSLKSLNDTMFLRNGRLEVVLKTGQDTLYVKGTCKADTIYRTHRVAVEKVMVVRPNRTDALIAKIPWLVAGLIAMAGLAGYVVFRKRQFNSLLS